LDRRLALAIVPGAALVALVLWRLGGTMAPIHGYMIGLAVYWLAVLLPLCLIKLGPAGMIAALRPRWPGWPGLGLLALPVVALAAKVLPDGSFAALPGALVLWVVVGALVNGTLEEAFWRGALLEAAPSRPALIASLGLFTAWHLALLAARQVELTGGAPALLGGAAALGAIWLYGRAVSGTAGAGALGHVGVNLFAFADLAALNLPAPI
jgi:hypothetical protein